MQETVLVIFDDEATEEEKEILKLSFSGEVILLGALYAVTERVTEQFSGESFFSHNVKRTTLKLNRLIKVQQP
jgi:hypothetical protein